MAEVYNKDKMRAGLENLKSGIGSIRLGMDQIRLSVANTEGDTYSYVTLGLLLIEPVLQIVWQLYERFRDRFGR